MTSTPGDSWVAESPSRYGNLAYPRHDDPIGLSLSLYGEWAQPEIELLTSFLAPGDTAVDVGAYVGTHTMAFSRAVGPTGHVLALEPRPEIFKILERNVTAGDNSGVVTRQVAAAAQPAELLVRPMNLSEHVNAGASALTAVDEGPGAVVEATTIDALQLNACRLLKIDAEGMDAEVLRGAESTVIRLRPVVFAEVREVDAAAQMLAALRWDTYRLFVAQTSVYNPDNYLGAQSNVFGFAQETALLMVPEEDSDSVPESTPQSTLVACRTLDEVARVLISTPRFGDHGPHDRDYVALRRSLLDLQQRFEQLEQEVQRGSFRERALEKRILSAKNNEEQLHSRLSQAQRVITDMATSKSWRVTAPLRSVRKRS